MRNMRTIKLFCILTVGILLIAGTAAAQGEGKLRVKIPTAPELYATEPQPLTATQCAQCHVSVFRSLKDDGGKHRFDCQKCHASFHAYNPKKANWDATMPQCATCHSEPHGPKVADCASCHTNPHTPKKVAMTAKLASICTECHPGPQEQLTKFPSKHTKVACSRCHTAHGLKPSCLNCHKPHQPGQQLAACLKCHPAHKPLQIAIEKETPSATCGACHSRVYASWQKTPSKHGKVNCVICHQAKHKQVPQCTECHQAPHKKEILAKFPKCLGCHLDVHDLPVQTKK